LVRDSKGKVFGAYCSEAWKKSLHFYGLGESFIFTFDDNKIIKAFHFSGLNEKI
jgi:hypothetical protein